jgi:curved DNA-binding protein CbpA
MNPLQEPTVSDLIATVLSCYRAPALHNEALRGDAPVPADIALLFRLAGGGDPSELGLQGASELDQETLQKAARFYIEQTLFRRDADHYRLLGLNPGAEDAQIKEHHRLLMRLFHPDRSPETDDWKDNYVNRINHAYNALRDDHTRSRYDADLAAGRVGIAIDRVSHLSPVVTGYRHGRGGAYPQPPKRSSRRIPMYVMSVIALLALLFVGSVYIENRPVPKTSSLQLADTVQSDAGSLVKSHTASASARRDEIPMSPELEAKLDDLLAMDQAARASRERYAKSEAVSPASRVRSRNTETSVRTAEKPPGNTTVPRSSEPAVASVLPVQVTAPAVIPAPQAVSAANVPNSLRMTDGLKPGASASEPAASQPSPVPRSRQDEMTAVGIQAYELDKLLFRYVLFYERGDITGFMSLFEEGARANPGGKAKIRQEYERFFKNSQLRNLDFGPANWKVGADSSTAKIPYRVTIRSKGDSENKVFSGVLFFEATKRGNDLLISALFDSSGDMT